MWVSVSLYKLAYYWQWFRLCVSVTQMCEQAIVYPAGKQSCSELGLLFKTLGGMSERQLGQKQREEGCVRRERGSHTNILYVQNLLHHWPNTVLPIIVSVRSLQLSSGAAVADGLCGSKWVSIQDRSLQNSRATEWGWPWVEVEGVCSV